MPHSIPVGGRMKNAMRRAALVAVALSFTACQDTLAPVSEDPEEFATVAQQSATRVPDEYVVLFTDDVTDAKGLARQLVSQSNGRLGSDYSAAVKGFSAVLSEQAVLALSNNPHVAMIEAVQTVHAAGVQSPAPWWLDRVDQRGNVLDGSFSWTNTGAGVTVYILDSGIRISHQDFEGRASYGYDAITNTTTADDCNGHGTHVAGSVAGKVYGVAKGARMSAVRVLDCAGNGTSSSLIAGLDWVARNHVSPAVANVSVSGAFSATVNQAVANLIASGVTVTVAAGDGGSDACNYSPASAPGALTVGAMVSEMGVDAQGSYSNFGPCVDIFAPGYQIISDWNSSDTGTWLLTGTSPSAPLVAGTAAAYLSSNPSAGPAEVSNAVLSAATTGALVGLGAGSPNRLLYTGIGGASAPPPPPPPPPPATNAAPVANFTASCLKASCTFNGSSSTDDVGISSYLWSFGDGTTATSSTPMVKHLYTAKGNYTVSATLTVTDASGATGRAQKSLTIKNPGK